MKYYKIMKDSEFIGAGTSSDLRRYQDKHKILVGCDESCAQYIQFKDTLYRDKWMFLQTHAYDYIMATVAEIAAEEYEILRKAMDNGEEIVIPEPMVEQLIETPIEDSVEFLKQVTLAEISKACQEAIIAGVDVDGEHFSFTIYDQNNLRDAMNFDGVMLHADGKPFKQYTKEQVLKIWQAEKENQYKHQMYYHKLKQYLESLTDVNDICAVSYGMEIPVTEPTA